MTTFIQLSQNIAFILSLTFIYGLLSPYMERITQRGQQVIRGLLFGTFAVISMMMPIQVEPGIFYDARTIVIVVAGIFGGVVPAFIAALLVALYRISVGGIGVPGALASIATSALIGCGLREYYRRRGEKPQPIALVLAGLAIALIGSVYGVLLSRVGYDIVQKTLSTTIIMYPVGLLLMGTLVSQQERQRTLERAVRESAQRFRTIFDSAFQYMALLQPDGRLVDVNQSALQLQNIDKTTVIGIPLWETEWGQAVPERRAKLIDAVSRAARGETVRLELTAETEGHEIALDFSLKPLMDADGKISLLIAEARDITARKELEQQRVSLTLEQERSRLLKKFISDVSHDLRTPLAVIRLNLELLRRTMDSPQQQQRVETLASQEQHLTRLLSDMMTMLTLDEQSNFQFKPLDLNFVAQMVVDSQHGAAQHKQQTLIYNHPQETPVVQGDQVELERALTKLLVNALSYTPKGGTVTLTIGAENEQALIEIQDTGIGILPEDLPNIFQRFFRADRARSMDTGGTGLGLPIAKRIVEAHGGEIEVESTPDAGTTFRIRLPLAVGELPKPAPDMLFE